MSAALSGADYRFLGGYRLFLAWLVLTSHSSSHLPSWVGPLALGNVGVFSFFVLSGLVIAEACDRFYPGAPHRFLLNRVLRIYPTYWMACGIALGIYVAAGHPDLRLDPVPILSNLSILYAPQGTFLWLSLIWAVGIELRFYFIAALLGAAERVIKNQRTLIFAAAGSLALALYCYTNAMEFKRLATFRHAPFFMLGMALYYAIVLRSPRGSVVAATTAPFALHAYYIYNLPGASPLATTVVFSIVVVAILTVARMRVSMRAARIDKAAGDLTYPLYLVHWPIVYLVETVLVERGPATYALILALSFAASGGVLLAERPIAALRDRVRRRRLYE